MWKAMDYSSSRSMETYTSIGMGSSYSIYDKISEHKIDLNMYIGLKIDNKPDIDILELKEHINKLYDFNDKLEKIVMEKIS